MQRAVASTIALLLLEFSWAGSAPRAADVTEGEVAAAAAQPPPAAPELPGRLISNRWGFQLGGYIMDFATEAAVGSSGLLGTFIRLEDQLGLDEDKTVLRAAGFVRFNHRHGLDVGYWQLRRDGVASLMEEIDFENITYVEADVRSTWDTAWLKVAWRYALMSTAKGEAGISAGLSTYRFDLALQGTARITDDQGQEILLENYATDKIILAPVPTLGFFLNYAIKPKWLFGMSGQLMDISFDEYDGKLLDIQVGMEWYFTPVFGVGAMINSTEINLKVSGDSPFIVDYAQSGIYGYLTFVFGDRPAPSIPRVKP